MDLAELVTQYGYLAVLVGSLLEGETILMLAGIATQQGYLSIGPVILVAFVGGTLGDQLLFLIGRRYGTRVIARYPRVAERAQPVHRLIERHQGLLIVGVRFMYGLRLIGPFVIGMSKVSAPRFALLNMLGAAIWAPLVVGAGALFGQGLALLLGDLGKFEAIALALVVLLAAAGYASHRKRAAADPDPDASAS